MAEYIDREEVLRALNKNSITKKITVVDSTSVYDTVKNIPAADVAEVKHGEWLEGNKRQPCSECLYRGARAWSYCPNCGAKMDGKEKGNE